uniref:Uncharacterized protein n=1 Tax=Cucumis melo TaxID=3656 RepID=A0A9I9EDQ7_CUCME
MSSQMIMHCQAYLRNIICESPHEFLAKLPVFFYIGCFFRQFFKSVGKADYLALCNGFIAVHLAPGSKFDFQKYIKRSLEDDFKIIAGVRLVNDLLKALQDNNRDYMYSMMKGDKLPDKRIWIKINKRYNVRGLTVLGFKGIN